MIRFTLPALFLLTACVSDPAITPAQELLFAQSDYAIVLEQVADYRDQCEAKPVMLQANCWRIVEEFRSIHREAIPLFDEAEAAVKTGDKPRLTIATTALSRIKARLEQRLVESFPKPPTTEGAP